MQASAILRRLSVVVSGVVQGVGFRPFVYELATRHGLTGFVQNNNGVVEIEVQGPQTALNKFLMDLTDQVPPLSEIDNIQSVTIDTTSDCGFFIKPSSSLSDGHKFMPPDAATCNQCLFELNDPQNRRYRYPFINCTNCGPRFTIIKSLPYDRHATTMADFQMCQLCQKEYQDPSNRRFHAQPNACAACGPTLAWIYKDDQIISGNEALSAAVARLRAGDILAVKGLGGFHLVCDASNHLLIQELRRRKNRSKKPFALMMADLEMIALHCQVSPQEAQALHRPSRPIVLLERARDSSLSEEIAPGTDCLGVMLPYTPLHHLLLRDFGKPLIATSANLSEEPIVIDNNDASVRLADLADGILQHDRDIYSRYDDSVVQFIDGQETVLRRSRGLAPRPIKLSFKAKRNVLALGGHLKNTFCLIRGDQALLSQHIGDLENMETEQHFKHTLKTYMDLFDIRPELIAHDLHPDYLSTTAAHSMAKELNLSTLPVQHHHAHIVACMAEHGLSSPTIGLAFDGLGYGSDGTLWGGEFLMARLGDYARLAHFEPVPMPGGSQAIRQPWRMAMSYILSDRSHHNDVFSPFLKGVAANHGELAVKLITKQIRSGFNAPLTSSCGRLFDAMAALLGVCQIADYEGQAAIELEALARKAPADALARREVYPFAVIAMDNQPQQIRTRDLFQAAFSDYRAGVEPSLIAAKFHATISDITLTLCKSIRHSTGVNDVCLSGGVFQNRLLLSMLVSSLKLNDFNVFTSIHVPPNDGGLSLGQAVAALAMHDALALPEPQGDHSCA